MNGQKKVALITGASSGIGLEFAHIFAREGYDLVLVARSEQRLNEIAADLKAKYGTNASVIPKDLNIPSAPDEIYAQLQQRGIAVEALVNSAGFATYGRFTEIDLAKELEMMQVNMVALTHLTKLFLRPMVERGSGKILNMASTAAFQPGPLMAVYYATKAYVLSFSEAIAQEVRGQGVSVTALCPGPTQSGFQKRADMEQSKLVQNGLMDARAVAEAGYQALVRGQTAIVPGLRNQVMAWMTRFFPRATTARLVMSAQSEAGH
jgi:short-subunit dehydrogenase